MIEIKNKPEIIKQLSTILRDFEIELNKYQSDVYLYLKENGKAELYVYTNIGGNSWLDDDHVTLYRDMPHFDSYADYFEQISDLANIANMSEKELIEKVAKDNDIDVDDVEYFDCKEYIKKSYSNELKKAYIELLEERCSTEEYERRAEEILEEYEN